MRAFMPEVASEMLGYLIERLMNLSLEINLILSHFVRLNANLPDILYFRLICPAKRQSTGCFVIFGYNRVD